jgi:predicted dehydrogenase
MTKTTTRWGIVGTGSVAALFAEGLADAPGARITAITSRSPERGSAFASRFGVRRTHASVDALADDGEVDVVYAATPNAEHHATVRTLLQAGKPVVCEKPFTLDAAEARELVALARAKRTFCMEAMWTRFMPAVRELVDRVRAGELGEVRAATLEMGHPFVFDASLPLFAARSGGALLDLGPYAVSLALLLFGQPTRVESAAAFGSSGVDEHVSALLTHADGQVSTLAVSLRTRLSNGASVAGTHGFARLHDPLYRPEALSIVRSPPIAIDRSAGPGATTTLRHRLRGAVSATRALVSPLPGGRTLLRPCHGNGYQYQAIEAIRCIHAGELESPIMPLDATVQVMQTLDAIREGWKKP